MSKNLLPDFNNTELAFRHLSDKDIRRGKKLFQLLSRPWLVKIGSLLARVALFVKFPIGWAVRPTVYAQFCGGEDILESEQTIDLLYKSGVRTILDYSAEGVDTEKDYVTIQSILSLMSGIYPFYKLKDVIDAYNQLER